MDSVTQFALGSVVAHAVAGRGGGRKALLWGGIIATMPDMDVVITPFLDTVDALRAHRGYSHALPIQLALAPIISLLPWLVQRKPEKNHVSYLRWLVVTVLVLGSHSMIDFFTIYGTQLLLPFSDARYALGNFFIIDPLFTLPLLFALLLALIKKNAVALSRGALIICSLYALFSLASLYWVSSNVSELLARENISHKSQFVAAAPFTTLLWRIVAVDEQYWYEGYYSLLKRPQKLAFKRYQRKLGWLRVIGDHSAMPTLRWFSKGFFQLRRKDGEIVLEDLRFGHGQQLFFGWVLARQSASREWRKVDPPLRVREAKVDFGDIKTLLGRL